MGKHKTFRPPETIDDWKSELEEIEDQMQSIEEHLEQKAKFWKDNDSVPEFIEEILNSKLEQLLNKKEELQDKIEQGEKDEKEWEEFKKDHWYP